MTRPALAIARKDLTDLARSKLVWVTTLVFLGLIVPQIHWRATNPFEVLVDAVQEQVLAPFALLVGPVAIVAAYASVVGERESGSLRVLLSFPADRRSVVLGKLLSRSVLLLATALLTYAALGAVLLQAYGTLDAIEYLADGLLLSLYTVMWVGLSVGASAAVSTNVRAIALLFGLYLALGPLELWRQTVVRAVGILLGDQSRVDGLTYVANPASDAPEWFLYAARTNPTKAFLAANQWTSHVLTPSDQTILRNGLAHNAFGAVVIVAWTVVPLLIGYWRFERGDLG